MTTAPCWLSFVTAACRSSGSVFIISLITFILIFSTTTVHGLDSGQQQRQVDGEARRLVLVLRVVSRREEALRLRQEILGYVQVQEAILWGGEERRSELDCSQMLSFVQHEWALCDWSCFLPNPSDKLKLCCSMKSSTIDWFTSSISNLITKEAWNVDFFCDFCL